MNSSLSIAVIGGDAAGMSAASKAKRTNPEAQVTVFERGEYVSYAACGLPYWLSGSVPNTGDLIARTPEQFAKQGIHVHLNTEVVDIEPRRHRFMVQNPDGQTETRDYDKLIIATGARPHQLDVPGAQLPGVFVLRTIPHAHSIRDYFSQRQIRNAVVIGGGYIGLEMVEALHKLQMRTALIQRTSHLMSRTFDPQMADLIRRYLEGEGVTVVTDEAVVRFEGTTQLNAVVTESGKVFPAEIVVVGVGTKPNVELAQAAGIEIGKTGAIRVDNALRTSAADVYAAGDCAEARHLVSNRMVHIPLGTTANKQGRTAGENAAGRHATFRGVVGTAVCKVLDLTLARTGLTEREAREAGFDADSSQIEAASWAHYFEDPPQTHVRLVSDRRTRKLLGGQLIGPAPSAKRIDVIATALHAGMTLDSFAELDLSYAPPYAPVWDPLLIAANVARGR